MPDTGAPEDALRARSLVERRWAAVVARDPRADGRFVYAVRSTGIYCRPTCPSRRPRRENVAFFDAAEQAEAAGYRACLRCDPHGVSAIQRVVAEVQRMVEEGEREPTLAEMARQIGLSPGHLQRVFKRATGLSPKRYAMARREERLKARLRAGEDVGRALFEAGYGSSRALYADAGERLGMAPGRYRGGGAGERLALLEADTELGVLLLAATARGLVAARLGDDPGTLRHALRSEYPRAEMVPAREGEERAGMLAHADRIRRYLAGDSTRLDLPLDLRGSDFQRRVWQALRRIPYGETRSYGEVAAMIDRPGAARAVARACATNPVALVVPCHRVVAAGGALSGYRWGAERKRALLAREAKHGGG